ncbi:UNVERIFIED_CONTAM: Retrovirus-related Pol polyprotein from transposon TNT 1-94 [Sesamum indicum]
MSEKIQALEKESNPAADLSSKGQEGYWLKARLKAKGYNKIEGVDFIENFSPIAKTVTVRVFLSIAAARSWPVHQLDINNSFLHGHLDEEDGVLTIEVLYGLNPASCQWNHEFTKKLEEYGFKQSASDHCLFIKVTTGGFLALLVYVDDILVMGLAKELIMDVKRYLYGLFTIKDLGYVKYCLGLGITQSPKGMSVAQHKYMQDIVSDTGMVDAKTALTYFPQG